MIEIGGSCERASLTDLETRVNAFAADTAYLYTA